jgi:MFS family permease
MTNPPRAAFSRTHHGHYDVRVGAAGYAPIVGTFGALSVTAIVVVFTVPTSRPTHGGVYLVLATGLLIVGMLGSLLAAIGLAAIAAERVPTANLAGSVMYIGVPVAVSLAAILGAFEVLAALYEPASTQLFAMIVAAGGLFGVAFVAFAIADSTSLGPVDDLEHAAWSKTKKWLKSRDEANKWTYIVAATGTLPVLLSAVLRFSGVTARPTRIETNLLVGVGIFLTMIGTLASLIRSSHRSDDKQIELRMPEAFVTTQAIGGYVLLLMIFLP